MALGIFAVIALTIHLYNEWTIYRHKICCYCFVRQNTRIDKCVFRAVTILLRPLTNCIVSLCPKRGWRFTRQGVLNGMAAILVLFQFIVHIVGDWELITALFSNTSFNDLGKAPTFASVAETGKTLLQVGGWSLAIWDVIDFLASAGKVKTRIGHR